MKLKKNIKLSIFIFIFTLGYSVESFSCDTMYTNDSYVLLSNLLEINSTNKQDHISQLKAYREWSDVYLRLKKSSEETKDENCIKMYLFSIFVAYTIGSSEITEHIGETFLPFFRQQPDKIISILKDHYFLTNSICKALTGYFELMDDVNVENERRTFISKYSGKFRLILDENKLNKCLSQF